MMNKQIQISFTVSPETRERIKEAAKCDHRTVSGWVGKVVELVLADLERRDSNCNTKPLTPDKRLDRH